MHRPTEWPSYRIILHLNGGSVIPVPSQGASLSDAESLALNEARRLGERVRSIALQRGESVATPVFDPLRPAAGVCGGWSDVCWSTVRCWSLTDLSRSIADPPTIAMQSAESLSEPFATPGPARLLNPEESSPSSNAPPISPQTAIAISQEVVHRSTRWDVTVSIAVLVLVYFIFLILQR